MDDVPPTRYSAHRPARRRFQFDLRRLLLAMILLAVMLGALAGMLRPGPTWHMADGLADDLARGASARTLPDEPRGDVLQVKRDPGEVKIYLLVAVLGPLGVMVLFAVARKAARMWRVPRAL